MDKFKRCSLILGLCLLMITQADKLKAQYLEYFGSDYLAAKNILVDNAALTDSLFSPEDKALKCAIIFPELIRFNYFQNLIELTSLKVGYTKYGSRFVDFSVGYCQMKPSFIEKLEQTLLTDSVLVIKYSHLLDYPMADTLEIRKKRLERLDSFALQLNYINAFCDIVDKKFKGCDWASTEDKVKFYATVYNTGYHVSEANIREIMHKKLFPFGTKLNRNPFTYAEVALSYFNEINHQ